MTLRHAWTDLLMKSMSRVHRAVLTLSGGRIGWSLGSLTAVELHTIGRTTGKRRSTMLTSPVHDDRVTCSSHPKEETTETRSGTRTSSPTRMSS